MHRLAKPSTGDGRAGSIPAPSAPSLPLGEKERVYRELDRVQRKCAAQRREIETLRDRGSAQEAAVLRIEADRYRQALSFIAYRLQQGPVPDDVLRSVVSSALLLRGLKTRDRRRVERVWERSESEELARALGVDRTHRQRRRDQR